MKAAVFAIFPNASSAESGINELVLSGFTVSDISILMAETTSVKHLKKPPSSPKDPRPSGGFTEGLAGLLFGWGTLETRQAGTLIAAGPLMMSVSMLMATGTVEGATEALMRLGFPENEATLYGGSLDEGSVMIAAHTEDDQEIKTAREIFERADAPEIGVTHEYATDSKNLPVETQT